MSAPNISIESLEDRVRNLQKVVLSQQNLEGAPDAQVCDSLLDVNKKLNDATAKHAVIQQVWKKLDQLESYLDVEYLAKIQSSVDEMKADVVLARADQLTVTASRLEEISKHQDALNDSSLKGIPEHSSKLEPLIQVHIEQEQDQLELNERVNELLTVYNSVVSSISQQFIEWDNQVTQCELAVREKNAIAIE